MELTHASFFSGVGGTDIGLETAGWRTVSLSEVDSYACAVLAERWPGVPNLGDITELDGDSIPDATLWSGGFPCQDLSVAGKRAGMGTEDERTRSGLAYSFLDLVERRRPPFILLENVPGLLSSNEGRDFRTLLDKMEELGYWWAYRILDARFFGVPQRRRRVFIVGVHVSTGLGASSPGEILSIGESCGRHPKKGVKKGKETSGVLADGAKSTRTVQSSFGHHGWTLGQQDADGGYLQVSPALGAVFNRPPDQQYYPISTKADSSRVRETDGLAGGSYDIIQVDGSEQAATFRGFGHGWQGQHNSTNSVAVTLQSAKNGPRYDADEAVNLLHYRKSGRAMSSESPETWVPDDTTNTLNGFDNGDIRTVELVLGSDIEDDPLLPKGYDSNRYRVIGNGVVAPVAEWIGRRIIEVERSYQVEQNQKEKGEFLGSGSPQDH